MVSPYVHGYVSECTCATESPNLSEGSRLEMDLIFMASAARAAPRCAAPQPVDFPRAIGYGLFLLCQ